MSGVGLLLAAVLTAQVAAAGLYHPNWWLQAHQPALALVFFGAVPFFPVALAVLCLSRLTSRIPAPVRRAAAPVVIFLTAWAVLGTIGAYTWSIHAW